MAMYWVTSISRRGCSAHRIANNNNIPKSIARRNVASSLLVIPVDPPPPPDSFPVEDETFPGILEELLLLLFPIAAVENIEVDDDNSNVDEIKDDVGNPFVDERGEALDDGDDDDS